MTASNRSSGYARLFPQLFQRLFFRLIAISVGVMMTAAVAADAEHHHGGAKMHPDRGMHHHWNAPAEALKRRNPVPADAASLHRGKKLFEQYCAACHGPHGRGDGPAGATLNPRPVDLVAMAGHHTDGDYAWKIENGRGPMPAWKGTLTQDQIWDVVNYIQRLGTHKH